MAKKAMRWGSFLIVSCLATACGRAQTLQADLSFPYAFHQWTTTGVSADLGVSFAGEHFLGLEFTTFSPNFTYAYPVYGSAQVSERIDSLQLAYRFSYPLGALIPGSRYAPFELYVGVAAGPGRVQQSLTYSAAAVAALLRPVSAQETLFCAELAAGLQFNLTPHFGIKAGVRYIDSINNVRLFNTDANTDTKTVEAGVVFRY
jgi:opacity protein-like surface antigen